MMTRDSYVFILGAGSAKPFGFPTGDELYQHICKIYPTHVEMGLPKSEAETFTTQLRLTTGVSIDRYLNVNKGFKNIGTHSIATAIHFFEERAKANLLKQGDWLTYLYQMMIQGLNTPEDFLRIHENKVSFVTFNYDRSVEHFLFSNLYGLLRNAEIKQEQVAKTILQVPIIHVYGKIGYLPWERGTYRDEFCDYQNPCTVSYGFDKAPAVGFLAGSTHEMIDLIYEQRQNNPDIQRAKECIQKASCVIFLGFGYEEMNLSILGLPRLLEEKRILGTGLGKTEKELSQIRHLLRTGAKIDILDCDCLVLLRKML